MTEKNAEQTTLTRTVRHFAATLVAVAAAFALMLAGSGTALAPNVIKSYGGLGTNTGALGVGYYVTSGTSTNVLRFPENQELFHSAAIGTPCYGTTESVGVGTPTTKVISPGYGGRKICR